VSGNVGTSGEWAREAGEGGKRWKRKEASEGGSRKGKRRKVVSNLIIDEDETLDPSLGGGSPKDHRISAPLEPAQSHTSAMFAPGTSFNTSLPNHNFDFDEDETLDLLLGGGNPEHHGISVAEPAQSHTFAMVAMFAPGTLFDAALTNYNFDFDEQIHSDMNGLNHGPNHVMNMPDFFNPSPNPASNMLDLDISQFPDLDMSANQDLWLHPL
jgi:hypothetical protein